MDSKNHLKFDSVTNNIFTLQERLQSQRLFKLCKENHLLKSLLSKLNRLNFRLQQLKIAQIKLPFLPLINLYLLNHHAFLKSKIILTAQKLKQIRLKYNFSSSLVILYISKMILCRKLKRTIHSIQLETLLSNKLIFQIAYKYKNQQANQ